MPELFLPSGEETETKRVSGYEVQNENWFYSILKMKPLIIALYTYSLPQKWSNNTPFHSPPPQKLGSSGDLQIVKTSLLTFPAFP